MTPTQEEIDDMFDRQPVLTNTVSFKEYIRQRMLENPQKFLDAVDKYKQGSTGDLKNLIDSATQDYRNMQRVREVNQGIKEYHFDVHHEGFVKHGGEWFLEHVKKLFEGDTDVKSKVISFIPQVVEEAKEPEEEEPTKAIVPIREQLVATGVQLARVFVRYRHNDERLIQNRIDRNNTYRGKRETWKDFGIRTELILNHTPKALSSKASRMKKNR